MDKDQERLLNRISLCRKEVFAKKFQLKRLSDEVAFWSKQLEYAEAELNPVPDLFKCEVTK